MGLVDDKDPLFSRHARQDLLGQTHREAAAQSVRVLVRLRCAEAVTVAQEKVRQAEEQALRPSARISARLGLWQRLLSTIGLESREPQGVQQDQGRNEIEIAKAQLERLIVTEAPRLVKNAEAVARAIEGQDDGEDTPMLDDRPRAAQRRGRKSSAEDQA